MYGCESGEICQLEQGDCNSNSIGDACECYADFDCDRKVNIADLIVIKKEYLRSDCDNQDPCYADCNEDGKVHIDDLMIMKYQYLRNDCAPCP